MLKAHKV